MNIPFAPPFISEDVIREVTDTLNSGWITTGPKVKQLESMMNEYTQMPQSICVNSWTSGALLVLKWWGIQPGDEVIIPAYTYAATALAVMHAGGIPVMVDVSRDFTMDVSQLRKAITAKTKVIMPVDFAGWPCDYDEINAIAKASAALFQPKNEHQKTLGRILVLSDSAHSFGASYKGKHTGSLTDVSVFSFHAVKNLSTAEGGAVALNLPTPFDNKAIYDYLCIATLHGQNKDALAKTQRGNWRYDIVEAGYKCNMTDLAAAIGLIEIERYDADTLVKRKQIVNSYLDLLKNDERLILPVFSNETKQGCYHLFPLRIRNCTEAQRDAIMQQIFAKDVSVNVHFLPVPGMTFYKSLGYQVNDYPVALKNSQCEISLPVFYDLTTEQIQTVVKALTEKYAAGRRGAGWIKVKPVHTLDLVVLAVEWGSGRREGWLSNIHLGARDAETGDLVMLGKTFKGMTDQTLAWQTERFTELALDPATVRDHYVVPVRPEQVVEIALDGVQRSSRYPGGIALRFARVVRYRDDKTSGDIDTLQQIKQLFGHD